MDIGPSTSDPDLRHFDELIESLAASGNPVLDGGFGPTQSGWECRFAARMNPAAVQVYVTSDAHAVSFDSATDTVQRRHCWSAVVGGHAQLPI